MMEQAQEAVKHINLKKEIPDEIISLAKKCDIQKVILFGSRARGDNRERSDIDLAVKGGNVRKFRLSVDDEIRTLLMFDVVNLDGPVNGALMESIEKEGMVLYEKA